MGTCHNNTECTGGLVCNATHTCGNCPNDSACGTGRICENNVCITGNCHTNANCSSGQVCVGNSCTACTSNAQCGTGQVCLPNGTCTPGNCLTGANCTAAQVCKANTCGVCATDGECISTTTGHGANHLCINGSCVAGNCRAAGDCASGSLICNTSSMLCGACSAGAAGDAQCAAEYNGAFICNGGTCISGNCHSTANCSNGQICNLTTHTCQACGAGAAGDAQCADVANYGANHICETGACRTGNCHTAGDCTGNSTQICTNFTCGMCSTNTDCTTAYGANHVCSGGACTSGNCNTSADCAGSNQVCNTTSHLCEACDTDLKCTGDIAVRRDAHLPEERRRHERTVCTRQLPQHLQRLHDTGQVCNNATHLCGGCNSSDITCKNDTTYGANTICLTSSNTCVQGDCHDTSNECQVGQICGASTAHTCGTCTTDGQCTGDARYGAGNICYQGSCGVGNCHATSDDCMGTNAGYLCGVTTEHLRPLHRRRPVQVRLVLWPDDDVQHDLRREPGQVRPQRLQQQQQPRAPPTPRTSAAAAPASPGTAAATTIAPTTRTSGWALRARTTTARSATT